VITIKFIAVSFTFTNSAGVGLSGLLSPLLFAVYMDVLINGLQNAGYGCKLVQRFVGCLSVICRRR